MYRSMVKICFIWMFIPLDFLSRAEGFPVILLKEHDVRVLTGSLPPFLNMPGPKIYGWTNKHQAQKVQSLCPLDLASLPCRTNQDIPCS